jgi:LmbE family N-acetylglucosaminyl deacetylase
MSLFARAIWLGALLLALAALPGAAAARTIMIISPHPDDESLISAGRVRAAVEAGDTIKIVVVTNGDIGGVERGLQREGESVAAAQILGLSEQDVIFLGYPDGSMMEIYGAASPTDVIASAAGQTQTYGNRGLGGMDFHRFFFGSPGPYNRVTVEQDIRTLLTNIRPDEVYTVSNFDTHPDHHATALFVTEALAALKRSGALPSTRLYQGLVWPDSPETWPGASGCEPSTPFPPPPADSQHEWKRTLRAVVLANLKCEALQAYTTSIDQHLLSFARKDEFFWLSDFGANLALTAQVTASSEAGSNQGRMKAVDGLIDGAPHDAAREWVSAGELSGAWIELAWPAPVSVAQVNLYDRPLGGENVLAGTLSFSDGTSIAVGALPPDGKALPVTFSPKTVTRVRFTINQAEGTAAGLSEIQVLGLQSSANVPPHFLEGPGGDSEKVIRATETASFSVRAHDLNGDALQYQWSADGGTIAGNGASAVFTPPPVTASTVFTISVQVLDGRGGIARNVAFVTATPATDGLSLSPPSVLGGDSAQGTVTLANPAPAGGVSVPLSSSNAAVAQVPASVTVAGGATTATFPVSTSSVAARTEVTLSANIGGTKRTAALVVTPRPSPAPPANLLLSPDSIGDANWIVLGPLSASLGFAAAPDGTQNASRVFTTQPGGHALAQQVAVEKNTSYTFSFLARNNGGTAASYSVFDATQGADIIPSTPYVSSINGSSWTQVSVTFKTAADTTSILVYPVRDSGAPVDALLWRATLVRADAAPAPAIAALALSPTSVTGGASATGTVTLNGPAPTGGAQVTLSSSHAAAAVPASVTVPAGASSATFSVATSAVGASMPVAISGSFGGATQTASLTVLPAAVSSLSVSPASITGGNAATGTVTLSGPAPAGGAQVALSSGHPAAAVPASVTISAGATSASFNVTTSPVATAAPVTLSASYAGSTRTASLTVVPPGVAALSLGAASVTGGSPTTGTVTLDGPAPAGGAQVALSSNNAAAAVPASVTIPAGATSASFNVTTSAVATSTPATISASYGGRTQTVTLTVLPAVLSSLTLNPTSVVGSPLLGNSTGTVTLDGPAPAGGAVVLLSDDSSAASVPSTVTIPAGATSATFTVRTGIVLLSTTARITATYRGASRSANLQITL